MPRISLYKQIKANNGWMLAKASFDSRVRIRKDHVTVAGKDELHGPMNRYRQQFPGVVDEESMLGDKVRAVGCDGVSAIVGCLAADPERLARTHRPAAVKTLAA
jgi:hypothetical protein